MKNILFIIGITAGLAAIVCSTIAQSTNAPGTRSLGPVPAPSQVPLIVNSSNGTLLSPLNFFAANQNSIVNTSNHVFNLRDFGATNDGFCFNNITISGGSANLTATGFWAAETGHTNFTQGDSIVGKVICIYSVGGVVTATGTNCFTTTVASVTDGTHLVLAQAVPNTVSGATAGGVIGSDNTAALQSAFNTISNGSVEIQVPAGIYVLNGAPSGTNRAQVVIPPITAAPGSINRTLKLTGQFPSFISQSAIGNFGGMNSSGAMFWSTRTNLNHGYCIEGQNYVSPSYVNAGNGLGATNITYPNAVHVVIEGVNWRACWNNGGYLLALHGVGTARLNNLRIDTGYTLYNVPPPTKLAASYNGTNYLDGSWGLTVPTASSAGPTRIDNVEICGFYNGVNIGEHVYAGNVQIESCMIGINTSSYPAGGGHRGWWNVDFEACRTNLISEGLPLQVMILATSESPNTGDWSFTGATLVSDTGNALAGTLWYESTSGNLPVYGAVNLNIIRDGLTGQQSTNTYVNTPLLNATAVNIGNTATATPLTLVSSGNSIQLFNQSENEIEFYANNFTDFWQQGVPGATRGNAAFNDFHLSTFADRIATPTFIWHHDGQYETKSNVISHGQATVDYAVTWHSNSMAIIGAMINAMANGDNLEFNSNAVHYGVSKSPSGVLTTNKVYP